MRNLDIIGKILVSDRFLFCERIISAHNKNVGEQGDSFQFSDEVMEKCDVFVTPGAIFGSEGKRYVRITLCCPAELLEKAAQRVRERLNK